MNDCETRWGSTFKAIERFLEQEAAIRKVLTHDYSSTHLIMSGAQLTTLNSIYEALKPVSIFTDLLSGELLSFFKPFSQIFKIICTIKVLIIVRSYQKAVGDPYVFILLLNDLWRY